MKIPAIRGNIGNWIYYTSTLKFELVGKLVSKIDRELHKSKGLSDMIQRSVTDNFKNISEYLIHQNDRFFSSIVLAIYDGDPQWIEIELDDGESSFYNVGFLEFNGKEKIFPVEGQHIVEGIKDAMKKNESIIEDEVPVIFIGHKNTDEG
jgi:DNA sulfur modification protein DndB